METRTSTVGETTYISPDSAITEASLPDLESRVQSLKEGGPVNLVLDLTHVPYIDSSGLEFILDLSVELKEGGGSLRLVNANRTCRDILAITGLDRTMVVCDDHDPSCRTSA